MLLFHGTNIKEVTTLSSRLGNHRSIMLNHALLFVNAFEGLPLAVAMLGALLHRDPKLLRWEYYLRQLKEKKLNRIRGDGMESDFVTLSASIAISVETLARDNKRVFDLYKTFVVFEDDATISSQVRRRACVLSGVVGGFGFVLGFDSIV